MSVDCLIVGFNSSQKRMIPNMLRENYNFKKSIKINNKEFDIMEALSFARGNKSKYILDEIPPLGVLTLDSYLRKNGFVSKVINFFANELEELIVELKNTPTVIAITTTHYVHPMPLIEVINFIRFYNKKSKIVIGGPYIANLYKLHDIDKFSQYLNCIDSDYCIIENQGEKTLCELIKAIKLSKELSSIPNLMINDKNTWKYTFKKNESSHLDNNIINWKYYFKKGIKTPILTRTSLGCPFGCAFCTSGYQKDCLYTPASKAVIVEKLNMMKETGVKYVSFIDDTFNYPEQRLIDICKLMISNNYQFNWFSFFRCYEKVNKETVQVMKKSGCTVIYMGVESGDINILENMNKSHTEPAEIIKWVQEFKAQGIITYISFIIGFPGETQESIDNTIKFINEAAPDYYSVRPWYFHPSTSIYSRRHEFGLTGIGDNWKHNSMNRNEALKSIDILIKLVEKSCYCPSDDITCNGILYLMSKGMNADEIKTLQVLSNKIRDKEDTEKEKMFIRFCNNLKISEGAEVKENAESFLDSKDHKDFMDKARWDVIKLIRS